MIQPSVLLADLDGLIRILLVLVFLIGPLVGQFLKSRQEAPPRPRPPRPPQPPPPAAGPRAEPAQQLEAEIEEFLRRVTGQPEAARRPEPARAQPPASAQPTARRPARRRPVARDVIQAEVVPADPQPLANRPVPRSELSQRHLERAGDSGRTVLEEVDRIDSHVHEVFDHQLGKLDLSAATTVDPHAASDENLDVWEGSGVRHVRLSAERLRQVEQIKTMLLDPYQARQAVILSEILKRPEF